MPQSKRVREATDHSSTSAGVPTAIDDSSHTTPPPPTSAGSIVVKVEPDLLKLLAIVGVVMLIVGLWSSGVIRFPEAPNLDANASLWLIFLTGLTAGGLSCLAVQGGLLATTIAQREQVLIESHVEDRVRTTEHAAPILLFLGSKLVAYTLLGALLGLFGSFISLSPTMRGLLQIGIGVFMLGVALQMLDVHPIFRYFTLQPPKRAQRLIRKHSKRDDVWTPLFLGALTVLIPCGVTQAMMLVAIASGSALRGALIMFAFVLGTSPVFFILGMLATRLSAKMHGAFLKLAAVTVAALAVLSIVTGYHLLPISGGASSPAAASVPSATAVVAPNANVAPPADLPAAAGMTIGNTATINVQAHGYMPEVVQIKAGMPATISLVTENVMGCTRGFVIPSLNVQKILPATGTETLEIPASPPGQIAYTCSMGMYNGVIEVVQ